MKKNTTQIIIQSPGALFAIVVYGILTITGLGNVIGDTRLKNALHFSIPIVAGLFWCLMGLMVLNLTLD